MPYISLVVRCNIMKRRTFLRLSSAALAGLGLSACGIKSAASQSTSPSFSEAPSDSSTDNIVDDGDDRLGMTLEEAQDFASQWERHIFIHRSDDLFYALPALLTAKRSHDEDGELTAIFSDLITYQDIYANLDTPSRNNMNLYQPGDELVYITSSSLPSSVTFSPFVTSGFTIPVFIDDSHTIFTFRDTSYGTGKELPVYSSRLFSDYDPEYITDSFITSLSSFKYNDIRINDISLDDYISSHTIVPFWAPDYGSVDYFIDLTNEIMNGGSSDVIISYYEGTAYHEIHLQINCTFYNFDTSNPISCNLVLTKNGYAVIDTSTLSQNMFYMISDPLADSPDSIVDFCFE